MSYETIGFVGLGNMGKPMAENLSKSGIKMIVFDAAGSEGKAPSGAIAAATIEEVAQAEVVFLSLPNGKISKLVCSQITEVKGKATKVIVDLSTAGIPEAQECAAICETEGVTFIDSPVSGGMRGAQDGTLTLMIAGNEDVLDSIRPLLNTFSKNIFYIGTFPGQGQAMKLINNFLAGTIQTATFEATIAGLRAGLDLQQMIDIINVSTGRSFMSTNVVPESIIPGTFDTGFAGALLTKDLNLYAESIKSLDTPHEIADTVLSLWTRFLERNPNGDSAEMFNFLKEQQVEVK